jgi:hypothetical protein
MADEPSGPLDDDTDRRPGPSPAGSVADRSQAEVEERLRAVGFGGQFGAREGARILCFTCHREFPAGEADADRARRVEGESDPADMAILVPVSCPHCHSSGTLALQFGPMASEEESDVIAALPRVPHSYDATAHDRTDATAHDRTDVDDVPDAAGSTRRA